ncbi:uncharacterized protein A4U43_C09F16770 [Asparagus officinalis]|uniref:GTD-binding domain-containing protein n=1 Tax=Asparagus officinalis TaxID=4686 RepID=A0A5P1E8A9_ASPOF|nr:uncharacterized protein A4U43_C09F16770 [Asparagus officinalis]
MPASSKAFEATWLRQELDESNRKAGRLDEALQERDHAKAQVEVEKQVAVHARYQLDEEYAALVKLQGEVAHLQKCPYRPWPKGHKCSTSWRRLRAIAEENHEGGIPGPYWIKTEVAIALT